MEKITRKVHKARHDIEFLETCSAYESIPKFLRIKLYRRNLETTETHLNYQRKLLDQEIKFKRRLLESLITDLNEAKLALKTAVSGLGTLYMALKPKASRQTHKFAT